MEVLVWEPPSLCNISASSTGSTDDVTAVDNSILYTSDTSLFERGQQHPLPEKISQTSFPIFALLKSAKLHNLDAVTSP